MNAALVTGPNQTPNYADIDLPTAKPGEQLITVAASALSHATRSRASGEHYSSSDVFPFVVGIDGVGRLEDGRRVYFVLPTFPNGGMAEVTVVPQAQCILLPDGLDDVMAAAIGNPGMSSWAALSERANFKAGETVLVNGATGAAGRLAVQIAKYRGANTVIATGRNREALASLRALGADVLVPLSTDLDALETAFMELAAAGIDIVLDYLWGESAERLLRAAARALPDQARLRFVQIGSLGGATITLPSPVLRAAAIELMGSGIGSIPVERFVHALREFVQAAVPGAFAIPVDLVPLDQVVDAWRRGDHAGRVVLTMGARGR